MLIRRFRPLDYAPYMARPAGATFEMTLWRHLHMMHFARIAVPIDQYLPRPIDLIYSVGATQAVWLGGSLMSGS